MRAAPAAGSGRDVETLLGLNQLLESREPVAKACAAVQTCLAANRDNLRGFFEQCFPLLLTKIFGYGGGSLSWLAAVAQPGKERDAAILVQLLSPKGKLLSAMQSADADHIIRFILPPERLPPRTQVLLSSEEGVKELQQWPQYANSIVMDPKSEHYQIQVNVFNYFLFWFAFYTMGKQSNHGRMDAGRYNSRVGRNIGKMKDWVSDTRETLFHGHHARPSSANPYLVILQDYLECFLPRSPDAQQARGSGVVLLGVLIESWLTFSDDVGGGTPPAAMAQRALRPTAAQRRQIAANMLAQAGQGGIAETAASSQATFLRQRMYQPPSDELVAAVTRLVVHLTCREQGGGVAPVHLGALSWLPAVPTLEAQLPPPPSLPGQYLGMAGGRSFQTLMRYVYRFLRVSMMRNPVENVGSMHKLLDLWAAAALPWTSQPLPRPSAPATPQSPPLTQITSHLPGLLHMNSPPAAQQAPARQLYSAEWRNHTLTTLPFIQLMLPLLIEVTVSRVQYSPQPLEPVKELLTVLQPLAESSELVDLLKMVDSSLEHFHASHHRTTEAAYADVLPFLCDQAVDWERVAGVDPSTRATMGISTIQPLFGVEPGSAAHNMAVLLQLEKLNMLEGGRKLLERLRAAALRILPLDDIPKSRPRSPILQSAVEPSRQQLRKSSWQDLQAQVASQKADIRRPITSHEIPLIVRAVLPIHEKFDLDLRCVADTRNVAAYLVLSSLLYSAAGSTGALLAAILLALAVHFQVQLEAGAAKAGEWFHM
mmetsp:Transcript_41324/g.105667  ORF Transcript_41324/g.105667 Transcript_41324/m.105667 type:complete len:767 (+) Transcript_41324:319-2619(+)